MKKVTKDTVGVEVHFEVLDEDEHPKGCFDDEELISHVLKGIEDGNEYAWFTAKVWASFDGIKGDPAYLGCCSYESREDFMSDDYYSDMVDEAIDNLNNRLSDLQETLAKLDGP